MGKISFVAMLYLTAAAGLLIGGGDLFVKAQFTLQGKDAVMRSSDATVLRAAKYAPNDSIRADVVYETEGGLVPVSATFLTGNVVQKLARGEGVPLRFLTGNPHRVLYQGEELPAGIGWLAFGAVALVVAVFAHRQLRREVTL